MPLFVTVRLKFALAGLTLALAAFLARPALADAVVLDAVKDNTLFGDPTKSNGKGPYLAAGRTNQSLPSGLRRGVVEFDLSSIPPGSAITEVRLCMYLMASGSASDFAVSLHRAQQEWGEGSSNTSQGSGAAATTGDATWLHTFSPTSTWALGGGDYAPAASATAIVGSSAGCTAWEDPQLVPDVQAWLDDPATNHGWILIGDESTAQSVKQFASRESTTLPTPLLTVTYTSGAGAVPEQEAEGEPLRIGKDGGVLSLTWGVSCRPFDTNYEVYEGTIDGLFENHTAIMCDIAGKTSAMVAIPEASSYYLVVPNNGSVEGSYGTRNLGAGAAERPAGGLACFPQAVAPCPVE